MTPATHTTSDVEDVTYPATVDGTRPRPPASTALGGFYLCMAGINTGLAIADAEVYRHFADAGLFAFVRTGWGEVVMARPMLWVLLLAFGELAIGVALLVGGDAARVGWLSVIAFHVLLLVFGWGIWLYAVPALTLAIVALRREWPRLA